MCAMSESCGAGCTSGGYEVGTSGCDHGSSGGCEVGSSSGGDFVHPVLYTPPAIGATTAVAGPSSTRHPMRPTAVLLAKHDGDHYHNAHTCRVAVTGFEVDASGETWYVVETRFGREGTGGPPIIVRRRFGDFKELHDALGCPSGLAPEDMTGQLSVRLRELIGPSPFGTGCIGPAPGGCLGPSPFAVTSGCFFFAGARRVQRQLLLNCYLCKAACDSTSRWVGGTSETRLRRLTISSRPPPASRLHAQRLLLFHSHICRCPSARRCR